MKYYLTDYFMTNVFIILGGIVFFMIFPKMLDLNLTSLSDLLQIKGIDVDAKIVLIAQFNRTNNKYYIYPR